MPRFIREAPQALTDRHGAESGLQILIRLRNVAALAAVVEQELIPWQQLQAERNGLTEVAGSPNAEPLRAALIKRGAADGDGSSHAARLLNASILAGDWQAISTLLEKGVPRIWGQDENGDWRVSAMIYYSNIFFLADLLVYLGGMVEMKVDHPIIVDLPSRVDAPLEVRRRES